MITVTLGIEKATEDIRRICISGHSNLSENGNDIICASVSALALGLYNGLSEYLGLKIEKDIEVGFMSFSIGRQSGIIDVQAQTLLSVFKMAIENIAYENSDYVKVILEEV